MNEEDLLGKALYITREMATKVLNDVGLVLPLGVSLDADGENVSTYFPRDTNREANFGQLLELVTTELTKRAASGAAVVALAATLQGEEGTTAIGIQVESHSSAVALFYPYRKRGKKWVIGDAEASDGLFVDPLIP
ncbi:MAG TPA: hypothetical protein VF618_24155 [Thermoanaerobaculia bacterium]